MRSVKKNEIGVLESSAIFYLPHSDFASKALYYILDMGFFYCNDKYRIARESIDSFLLIHVKSGTMGVKFRGEEYQVLPGHTIILDCHDPHEYYAVEDLNFYYFHYNGNSSKLYYDLIYNKCGCVITTANSKDFESMFQAILHQVRKHILNEHLISALVHRVLSDLYSSSQPDLMKMDETILKVIDYMESHFHEKITLADMSEYLQLSQSHLSHSFKAHTGSTPHQYLLDIRISHSRKLLITTEKTLDEIATLCGFQDPIHFIRIFKQRTGTTPHKFRQSVLHK
ncbi:MAG: helix-turn-helix domain-containing protein [Suipraeoptans sp.]